MSADLRCLPTVTGDGTGHIVDPTWSLLEEALAPVLRDGVVQDDFLAYCNDRDAWFGPIFRREKPWLQSATVKVHECC